MARSSPPRKQGLYDPQFEKDSCGVGFVVNIDGSRSNQIVHQALEVLTNLSHRGACGCDPESGDGAGILIQIPHEFFAEKCSELGIYLPSPGNYGIGMIFLPPNPAHRDQCQEILERIIEEEGQRVLGWRDIPVDSSAIGSVAHEAEPVVRQIFVGKDAVLDERQFERKLYVIRRRVESKIESLGLEDSEFFYVSSLSCVTVIYKGQLMAHQVAAF